jgi:hypothetical protein
MIIGGDVKTNILYMIIGGDVKTTTLYMIIVGDVKTTTLYMIILVEMLKLPFFTSLHDHWWRCLKHQLEG